MEASATVAAVGLSATAIGIYKKQPIIICIALAYFSSMELLQAFSYLVVDDCKNPANQIATMLGYLHIAFQPFFINMVSLYFIPQKIAEKIRVYVYFLCFITTVLLILKLYPFAWAGKCTIGYSLCGTTLCTLSGNWHIAWSLPLNGLFEGGYTGFPAYSITAFIVPMIYGSWKCTVYHVILGPFLATLLTSNHLEQPAVWCLLSIGIILLSLETPLRDYLHVKRWFWYPKKWLAD